MRTVRAKEEWQDIFQRATEDISGYRWALDQWGGEDYTYFDLFIEITYRRHRSLEALAVMMEDCPEEYREYRGMFSDLLKNADSRFSNIQGEAPFVECFASAVKRLDTVEGLLGKMQGHHNGTVMFEDEELMEELDQSGSEFLEMFLRHRCINDQCSHFTALAADDRDAHQKRFSSIDEKFHKLYYLLFGPLEHAIGEYRREAYAPRGYWWLTEPVPAKAPHDDLIPSLAAMGIRGLARATIQDHPDPEKLAAYAFQELTGSERRQVEAHAATCFACTEEILALRDVDASVTIPSYEEARAKALARMRLTELIEDWKEFLGDLREAAGEIADSLGRIFSEPLLIPTPVPVPVRGAPPPKGPEKIPDQIPRVYVVKRPRAENVPIIDAPARETDENMRLLAQVLSRAEFSYGLYGMGPRTGLKPLRPKVLTPKKPRLPIEVKREEVDGIEMVFLIAHRTPEEMAAFHSTLTAALEQGKFELPHTEPVVWVIAYIETEGAVPEGSTP